MIPAIPDKAAADLYDTLGDWQATPPITAQDAYALWCEHVSRAVAAAPFAETFLADLPPHLQFITTDRGFKRLPLIPGTHGGQPAGHVSVRESSAAAGPHLWISASHPSDRNDPNSTRVEGCVHIRAEDAWRFADQIRYLVEHHYQGSAIPAAEPPKT